MRTIEADGIWTPSGWLTGHSLQIADGQIIDMPTAGRQHADVALPGRVLVPGFVNAHSHAFQRAFRGHVQWRASEVDDFWSWRDRMYATANALDPAGVEAVSALAFLEMAQAGVTTVGEFHYLHHQPDGSPYPDPDELAHRVISAARSVGVRIVLLRVAYARDRPGQPLRADQARFGDPTPGAVLDAIERLAGRAGPGARVGLAAHSVRALDAQWLGALSAWDGVVHAHVSEQPAENESCSAEHGVSPLRVLSDSGLVSERFTAIHLTWPLPGDIGLLEDAGGTVCVCPSTELDLGDGLLPVEARTRLRMCVGSDSHARIDPLHEARALELHGRALAGRRAVLGPTGDFDGPARAILDAATIAGERALGGTAPGLTAGAPADFVAIDLRGTAAVGVPPLQAVAFTADPAWVDAVWVGGTQIVRDGRHAHAAEIAERAAPYLP